MKVIGKNPKVFIGDKEVENISSFSLQGFVNNLEKLPRETYTFTGTFDPIDKDEIEEHLKALQAKGKDIITANIYNFDGEEREAKVKIGYQNGQIIIEPVDEDIREWVKGWISNGVGGNK